MRVFPPLCAFVLAIGIAHADLAPPPILPAKLPEKAGDVAVLKKDRTADLVGRAESGREDLDILVENIRRADRVTTDSRRVTAHDLPTNPCKSDMTAAWRLCVQWLRSSTVYMEAAALEVMRIRLSAALSDLRTVERRMSDAIEEQADGRVPARAIPKNPCQGWNVTFWQECVARVDAALAGNLPDETSATEIMRTRDRLSRALQAMLAAKRMESPGIEGARRFAARFGDAVARAVTRCEEAQRALARSVKAAGR